MSTQPSRPADVYTRARALARERRSPVYISDNQVVVERPSKTSAMVWPNGSVTWGNAQASDRKDRQHAA